MADNQNTQAGDQGGTAAVAAMDPAAMGGMAAVGGMAAGAAGTGSTGAAGAAALQIDVPPLVKEKFPDLMQLIQDTESMNQEERDYWYQILPIMTEDQIAKFREILLNEKQQLARLDKEYEDELTKLNEKHMIEWKEFETKEKRKALHGAEQKAEADEKAEEQALLDRLSNI